MSKDKAYKRTILKLILVLMIVFPFSVTILYSVLSADDFAMYNILSHDKLLLIEAVEQALVFWKGWGGGVPFNFFEICLNPLNFSLPYGYGAGIILELIFVIFVISLWWYIKTVSTAMLKCDSKAAFAIFIVALLGILNAGIYDEIYYWFVGSAYLIELIFMLWNQALIIRLMEKKFSFKYQLLLIIIGFTACFGYQLAVFSGIIYIIEIFKTNNYKQVKRWVPLAFMILGGALSAFAPGNLTRHAVIDTKLDIKQALLFAFQNEISSVIKAVNSPVYLLVIGICLVMGCKYVIIKQNKIAIYIIGGLVSLMGIIFPIALGYSSDDLPNRMEYLINIEIYIWSVIIALYAGGAIKLKDNTITEFIEENSKKLVAILVMVVMVQLSSLDIGAQNFRYEKLPWVYTAMNIKNAYNESKYNKDILEEIYTCEDDDVVIKYQEYQVTGLIKPVGIGTETTNWINEEIAKSAGKKSVVLVYE